MATAGLPRFTGCPIRLSAKVRAVLDLDRVEGRPLVHAVHSGYCRLAHGRCAVVMDVGRPPPPGSNDQAGASPLAFEFSDGANRMVVNCGSPLGQTGEWRRAARLTDAHSTICLGQANASTIVDNPLVERIFGTPALMGPRTVAAQVQATADGTVVAARHDGYVALFGIAVERRLWLSAARATCAARTASSPTSKAIRTSRRCRSRCASTCIRRSRPI
jgi:uncharacterized heparinase superfamily protein